MDLFLLCLDVFSRELDLEFRRLGSELDRDLVFLFFRCGDCSRDLFDLPN